MAYQKTEWRNSGSSCCTPFSTCMLSWCCPCILYGRTRHRVKNNGNMNGYSACNSSCLAFCGLTCLGVSFVLPMIRRGDMRAKYHLTGSGCTDCLCACCCAPCDLTQQDKEAADREKPGPVTQQPAKTEAANTMHYQQQQQPPHVPQHPPQQQYQQQQYQQPYQQQPHQQQQYQQHHY